MSGREAIWVPLIEIINNHPFIGHGPGVTTEHVMSLDFSSHNLYLQVALQNGYIGLALLLLLFFIIWISFWKVRKDNTIKLVSSFFIAILIHQLFEVSFTQNQLTVGMLQWLIISVGFSVLLAKKRSDIKI
ncbi:hypothetical protein NCCP2331_08270 [Sporosarcina sp. NCCP-2331]|nr:hypothetical protein NCCP2331_08270 [Sporosarcina sp. NCCP-2331]GLB54453.1 hypothetical protein NCCP2378_02380 [Sporosarcina sp. NCCP-2378]